MKKITTLFIIFFALIAPLSAQMVNGVDTLYGNEWINPNQTYFKINVAQDGIYRIPFQALEDGGVPMSSFQGNKAQLFYMGEEIPIHVSSDSSFGNGDYIEFYGLKNRSQLDRYLFVNPDDEMSNPEYSLFTDTSAYFLTWSENISTQRIDNLNNDLNNAPSSPEDYCWYVDSLVFSDAWSKDIHPAFVYHSRFEKGEGFTSPFQITQKIKLTPESIYASGPQSKLNFRYSTGTNIGDGPHEQDIIVNGTLQTTDIFVGIQANQHNFDLTTSSLGAELEIELTGKYDNKDKGGIAYAALTYPRIFDFGGRKQFHFKMDASSSTQLLQISNFDVEGSNPILYDITNKKRIVTTFDGTYVRIALPPSSSDRELVLSSDNSGITTITTIDEIDFIDFTQEDPNYIIISDKKLRDDGQGDDYVQAYADYRSSDDGRNFITTIIDVQQIYDQFGYGVNRHSLSVRNFGHFIVENWSDPRYILILGKGREYQTVRAPNDYLASEVDGSFHVPTFGALGGGDNLFLCGNLEYTPLISIGRIPAKNGKEIKHYLDKVIEHEANQNNPQTIEDKLWMKKMVHLGGGAPQEQALLRGYLEGMANIVENNKIGANVTSFYKQTADPIQISQTDVLKNLINDGVSVLTFFGHSSTGSFDYSIDNASSYDNKGRYPIMFSFGCYSGRIHTQAVGISEDFILTPEKGAIGFFATTGIGFADRLNIYGREFYRQLGGQSYGMGIGDLSRITIQNTENSIQYHGPQMTLAGDPAVRVFVGEGPDYIIDRESVAFSPNPISIQKDSFNLNFDVFNIGNNLSDSITIEVKQKLPNEDEQYVVASSRIPTPQYKSTINYTIPTYGGEALGANEFYIEVDKNNVVDEKPDPSAENNNTLLRVGTSESITVHFISKEIIPIFPEQYSIVSSPNLTLKASTSSTFSESQSYIFQIDTTETFDSPLLLEAEIKQSGGVVKWKPEVTYSNNTVYYWRVSPEEDPTLGGFVWRNSSFIYLAGSPSGWSQSHKYQYEKDKLSNLELQANGDIKFISNFKDIAVDNIAVDSVFTPNSSLTRLFIDQNPEGKYFGNPTAGIYVTVFDSIQVEPRFRPGKPNRIKYSFDFKTSNTTERQALIDFLNNEIEDGEFVLLYTVQKQNTSYEPEEWASDVNSIGTSIFDLLETQGATQVRNLETIGAVPYVFLYQKGISALSEVIASDINEVINFNYALPGSWDNGSMESTIIGPAQSWETLQWQATSQDNLPLDEFSVDIYGVDNLGNDSLVLSNIQNFETSISSIDANEFPYLKLSYNSRDTVNKSSAHLDYWRVLYTGLPEVALNPSSFFTFENDTLNQGEPLRLKIAVENIGRYDIDSLLMKYSITDQSNNQDTIFKRGAPLIVGDTLIANLNVDTRNFAGKNTLFIEANPNKDQAEQFHFNNIGFFDFFIREDNRNPILDVTFDGFHIMDGDLVSSKPHILVTLKDENQYLVLDDTSSFQVLLKKPGDSNLIPLIIDGETLTFYPATAGGSNKARLEYTPILEQDGTYQLLVLAQDISGNQSGDLAYKVSFEVTNQSSISKVLNYPNPFSTSTRFVFTVTGDQIPENMKIQIMTISGRIVREILQEELGPIHVGNNITQYDWDGTDEYGAKLANGVYLYRVVATKANGESFESFDTKADQFFKNGLGKMVILR